MDERLEQKKSILINAAYYALLLGIYIVFFRYVIYRIMPFFIAVLVALDRSLTVKICVPSGPITVMETSSSYMPSCHTKLVLMLSQSITITES